MRELDTLPSDELDRRGDALEAAAAGGPVEPWMAWLHAYHGLMRAALALKRRGPVSDAELGQIAVECQVTVDAAFAARVASPPHGRLMVVVFDRLAELFARPRKELWDALFPPRKGERAYRQR